MGTERTERGAAAALRHINQAWLDGRVDALTPLVHLDVVMVFPGFSGRIQGRDAFLAGFRDFCENARVEKYREHGHQVDVVGATAVATFEYEMVYVRSGERYRCTGRDLWVLQEQDGAWVAVWRTMLDLAEHPA
jgi:hypothetical protein